MFYLKFAIKDQPRRKEFTDFSELPSMEEVVRSLTQVFHYHGEDTIYVFGPTTPPMEIDQGALFIQMALPVFENIVRHLQDRCELRLIPPFGTSVQILQSKIEVEVTQESTISYTHHNIVS